VPTNQSKFPAVFKVLLKIDRVGLELSKVAIFWIHELLFAYASNSIS
jgi:hypothetical protein